MGRIKGELDQEVGQVMVWLVTKVNLHEAKARLAHYSRLVKAGETIILCDRNKPFAEIRPIGESVKSAPRRKLGLMKGMCPVGPEFFAGDAEIATAFESGAGAPFPGVQA